MSDSQTIVLDIVKPDGEVLSADVDECIIPGATGSFGVRRGHAPFIAEIGAGEIVYRIGSNESFVIYRRREKPETQHPFVNVLSHCSDDDPLAEIRSHLLFSALYHKSKPDQPIPESGVESRCRVVVPAGGGVLSLELGYRKPYIVERGTRLHARILVESEGEQEVVVDEWLRVVRRGASKLQQPYHRIAVDLTRYRGREIELVFETALEGSVQIHPLDFKGFAMIFRDPRVQHRSGGARP